MIFDTITNFAQYGAIIPHQQKIIQFINDVIDKKVNMESEKIEIDGDAVYALINRYKTIEANVWEAHKKYIDIQWMINGNESILFANSQNLTVTKPYDDAGDYMLLEGDGDKLTLSADKFAVFFPQDAHQPGLMVKQPENIVKIVIKVRI